MLDSLLRDLNEAARTMRRAPGITTAVVLVLALGVGASTAIFSVVYGVLFRPLPYRDAERLVVIQMDRAVEGMGRPVRAFFPLADLTALRAAARAFESIDFYSTELSVLSQNGFTQMVDAASVSESFFATVGGRLQSGRGLSPSDRTRASAVISDRLGRRLFGGDNAVGRLLTIGSQSYEIIGVAHRTFQIPSQQTDVWLPATDSKCCPFAAVARLRPQVSSSRAAADVNAVVNVLSSKSPRVYAGVHASVLGLRRELIGDVRLALWILSSAVGLLFAVACANAISLLIARNAARSRETAVRIALGASRARLCAQSLADAGLAVVAAGALGIAIAVALLDALRSFEPAGLPRLDALRVDLPVFIFTLAIAAATTVVIGLLPAVRSRQVFDAIRIGASVIGAGPERRRLHNLMVVVQLALSVVLLVCAGLLGRSLVRLMTTDIGVRTEGVATAAIDLAHGRRLTDARQTALAEAIVERVGLLPDVQAAGAGTSLPPSASNLRLTLKRAGDTVDYAASAIPATPGYFSALGVRLVKGRLFSDADDAARQQVMVMTADTARRFFGVEDPIGRTMTLPVLRNGVASSAEVTLVGVIANVKHSGLDAAPDDAVYRPLRQQPWPTLFLVARTSGDPAVLASVLSREIAAIDPAIVVSSAGTLDAIVSDEAAQPRFRSALLAALATLTLVIAAVGLYGVVAHTVSQRTTEFGVRMALGARRRDVMALVLLEGARLAGAGLALGIAGSLATARIFAGLLYGIGPADRVSYGLAAGLLLLVAATATYLPARRASRLDPTVALRAE